MNYEVELVSDGDGLAVVGEPSAVERFIASSGLATIAQSASNGTAFSATAGVAQAASDATANSGRWLKLTKESAENVKRFGLTPTDTPGVSHAMVGQRGDIKNWIQVVTSPGSMATNPAMLAGAAGTMAQLAMKQQMDAITDYLAVIDEKVDDVLRAQTNQVLAKLDGVELAVNEAMSIRESVGRVSEISWSKLEHQSASVLETQAYAIRQLEDLTEKLERNTKVGALADLAKKAKPEVTLWLETLARCIRLHDAIGVLELDRVLDASPDELDQHRIGIQAARRERLGQLAQHTEDLVRRMDSAVGTANAKVLLHPSNSPSIVKSRNAVAADVHEFRELIGLESTPDSSEARRWRDAASDSLATARATGAQGLENAKKVGSGARDRGVSAGGKIAGAVGPRVPRRRGRREPDGP